MAVDTTTARAVRVALAKKGIKPSDLAPMVGSSPVYISQICRGSSSPSQRMLAKIAEALGLKLSDLIALGED